MEWRDQGVVLAVRRHGETAAIIEVFTAEHGRHVGVVRGGASRRMAPVLQPGVQLDLTWRARLEEHIGAFVVEPVRSRAGLLGDGLALAGLNAICALSRAALAERDPHGVLYRATVALLDALEADREADREAGPDWPVRYLRWELLLLEEMGFGLDLSRCAVTGARDGLAFVSPRTGRAVSREGAGEWAARLLPLPECLLGQGPASAAELAAGLEVTGHFLTREMAALRHVPHLPEARARLLDLLAR